MGPPNIENTIKMHFRATLNFMILNFGQLGSVKFSVFIHFLCFLGYFPYSICGLDPFTSEPFKCGYDVIEQGGVQRTLLLSVVHTVHKCSV